MKQTLFLIIACSLAFNTYAGETVTSRGTWGSKSKKCGGMGICDVKSTQTPQAAGTHIKLTLITGTNTLDMTISDNDIETLPFEMVDEIMTGKFTMEESFTLSQELSDLLGAMDVITIAAGQYFVSHGENGHTVHFTL